MWDLTVEGNHNFYVAYGPGSVLVHNSEPSINTEKAIRSLSRRVAEHEAKLQAYIEDPYRFDNTGSYGNAPTDEIRQRIFAGRVKHLTQEIETFKKNIRDLGGAC